MEALVGLIAAIVLLALGFFAAVGRKQEPESLFEPPSPPLLSVEEPQISEPTIPVTVPESELEPEPERLTNRELLYEVAHSCLGKDMAKTQNELGCAEAVNAVHKLAFGVELGGGLSTAAMYRALLSHPDYIQVEEPLPGDIWISPTGMSSKGAKNGHVGIGGKTHVMSNNSFTYKWDAHYTRAGWLDYFGRVRGFPTFYFRRTGVSSREV